LFFLSSIALYFSTIVDFIVNLYTFYTCVRTCYVIDGYMYIYDECGL
jgi:hypothetical protein